MFEKTEHLFRKTSLERLSSPEQLDQVVRVIQPKDWLPLSLLGLLAFLGLGWSLLGRIPVTVEGQGVLINPRGVTPLQSPIMGQLQSLNMYPGQCVAEDDVLATINPSELKQQLDQERANLAQLQQQATENTLLRHQRAQLEQIAIATQRHQLEQQLLNLRTLAPELHSQATEAIATQQASLQQQLQNAQALAPVFEARFRNRQELAQNGALSQDTVLQADQEYRQIGHTITDLRSQLAQLEVQAVETRQRYLDNQSGLAQIKAQLDELNTRRKRFEQETLADVQTRERDIQAAQRQITQLAEQVARHSSINSPQAGCILEVIATTGQIVNPGTSLGTLQVGDLADQPIDSGVAYFTIQDGKQIQPGMRIFITPETVQRERFGSILAEVHSISPLPITRDGAHSVIGNTAIVDHLLAQSDAQMEVLAQLQPDRSTYSGYQWSSSTGPNLDFTPGTTFTARVVIEERAPITFLLPLLKDWSGMN